MQIILNGVLELILNQNKPSLTEANHRALCRFTYLVMVWTQMGSLGPFLSGCTRTWSYQKRKMITSLSSTIKLKKCFK